MSLDITIVVQVFIKEHMIENVINSLLQVKYIDSCNVVFWQDCLDGSKYYNNTEYVLHHKLTYEKIQQNILKFKNAEYKQNNKNMGTCATCKIAMDYAFTKSNYAILLEDDVIVSPNFINFFKYTIEKHMLNIEKNKIVCIAGESIFFNAKSKSVNSKEIDIAKQLIKDYELYKYYNYVENFVPSSCFCTSREIWNIIGSIRGLPTGCNRLNDYVQQNKLKVVMPVVPVCKDIGMLDKLGYSMKIHGKRFEQSSTPIWEYKNVYTLDESDNATFELVNINIDKLYDITVNLNMTDLQL